MKVLGGRNGRRRTSINGKVIWEMEELKNAIRFFLPGSGFTKEELFIEHDELTAAGDAYNEQQPLNMLDVICRLEKLAPDFHGVRISEQTTLIRKRLSLSSGLTLTAGSKNILFMKDETLTTINFLDFYQEYLQPKIME